MRKILVSAALAGAMLIGQSGVASADDVSVTATITAGGIGSRTLATTPITLVSSAGSATLSGALTATVTEAAVTGVTPWHVTASMGVLTKGSDTIAATNMSIDNRTTVQVAGGGTSTNPSGSEAFGATRYLHTTTGQSTTAAYTGTYTDTATLTLAVPNAQATGAYTGTMTVTLMQ